MSELVKQLTEQTKTLVKHEMRLAQVELQEKGKKVGASGPGCSAPVGSWPSSAPRR